MLINIDNKNVKYFSVGKETEQSSIETIAN